MSSEYVGRAKDVLQHIAQSEEPDVDVLARRQRFLKAREKSLAKEALDDKHHPVYATTPLPTHDAVLRHKQEESDQSIERGFCKLQTVQKAELRAKDGLSEEASPEPSPDDSLKSSVLAKELIPVWMTEEQYRELGYPEIDPILKDREYQRRQLEQEMVDPRVNPNLLRNPDDPEFLACAARKPFNKAMLRSEQHWHTRREVWRRQLCTVEQANKDREIVAELLEDCSAETKRTVVPILKYRYTELFLTDSFARARELNVEFKDYLEMKEQQEALHTIRNRIDREGPQAADDLLRERDARLKMMEGEMAKEQLDKERAGKADRPVADVHTLAEILNEGEKCKKDGLHEWKLGNWAEAEVSWRQGEEALKQWKVSERDPSAKKAHAELRITLLKNLSQARIKLGMWSQALESADAALVLDPEDHKAWFRRTCALEGLGRLDEADDCLTKIEDISLDRVDQKRILRDVNAKREKFQALRQKEADNKKQMLERALAKGIFSDERTKLVNEVPPEQPKREKKPKIEMGAEWKDNRKKLTKDGADDLLSDLINAYMDSTFQQQILKLSRDVRRDRREFIANLHKVSLSVQKPVLEKWGFEPSNKGLLEMSSAIQDHTRGKSGDRKLREKNAEVLKALYGDMYELVTNPSAVEQYTWDTKLSGLSGKSGAASDSD